MGWRPGIVGELVVGTSTDSQSGYTLEAGEPVIVGDYSTEARFTVHPALEEHGVLSGMSVRIGEPQKPYGVLAAFSSRRGRFTRDDANFLQAVANVLAAAVDRLRAEAELRTSRDQLAAIVGTIDEGITVRDRERLIFANDAAARQTGFETAEELLSASDTVLDRFDIFDADGQPMPVDQLPGRRAMASGEPTEAVVGFRIRETGDVRWSIVRANALRDADGHVTHVINTFRDITRRALVGSSRASFLADAVAVLSSTLDTHEAARRLADLAVPRLADYCTVHLRDADGIDRERGAGARRSGTAARSHASCSEIAVVDPKHQRGVPRVIREGVHEMAEITPELMERAAAMLTERELALFEQLEMRSYLIVPLMGRAGADRRAQPGHGRVGPAARRARSGAGPRARRAGGHRPRECAALPDGRRPPRPAGRGPWRPRRGRGRLRRRGCAPAGKCCGGVDVPRPAAGDLERAARAHRPRRGARTDHDEASAQDQLEVQIDGGPRWIEIRRYRTTGDARDRPRRERPRSWCCATSPRRVAAKAARDAFLGVLSHELRTPITTIYGGSELLQRGLDGERRDDVITDIRVESERLARLVEDLLVMTRIERGTVEISDEPILIQRLLPTVVHSFNTQRPDVEVTLNINPRLSAVRGDPTYVEQVVRNLLTNATRYGDGARLGRRE